MKVGIFGSCVSRDMTAHAGDTVAVYVARQSLISATTPGVTIDATADLTSPFQRRVVESDLASTGLDLIEKARPDVLIVDLVDERLGVIPLTGGAYATDSQELKESGIKAHLPAVGEDIELGTPEHLLLWKAAARAWVARLPAPTVVLRTPFADGPGVRPYMGHPARVWDARFGPYFAHLEALGLTVLSLPERLAVADPDHRWGPAAYHYQPAAYAWLRDAVTATLTA